jgi:hypothetical protein
MHARTRTKTHPVKGSVTTKRPRTPAKGSTTPRARSPRREEGPPRRPLRELLRTSVLSPATSTAAAAGGGKGGGARCCLVLDDEAVARLPAWHICARRILFIIIPLLPAAPGRGQEPDRVEKKGEEHSFIFALCQ